MVEEVIWTEQASLDFRQVLVYLYEEWNYNIEIEFYNRVFEVIELIRGFPEIGSLIIRRPGTRKFLITRFNYIVYRISDNKLYILSFLDTRMK